MRAAMASGAVVSICHPKPFGPPWEYSNEGGFDAIEVWNGPWAQLNSASLAHWDGLLRRGVRCAAVGGSDTHYLRRRDVAARHQDSIGTPTTWVEAEATVGSILAALRDGRSFVSESPRGPQIYLDADPARIGRISIEVRDAENARVEVITAAGRIASRPAADDSLVFDVPGDARFVRAQLVAENGDLRALTNPLWMERP